MTKQITNKNNSQNQNNITYLIVSQIEFEKKLKERISSGAELMNKNIITEFDYSKLIRDFSDWNDYNSEYLKQSFNFQQNEYKNDYDKVGNYIGLYEKDRSPVKKLQITKSKILSKIDFLKKLKAKTELIKSSFENRNFGNDETKNFEMNKKEVFIVHGHDNEAKINTARFIEKLGFKPIILHEQASMGNTVIEKIEQYSDVGFGIVLYTPCDFGGKKGNEDSFKNRARQNVVFEHGFLIGKIGRQNVCALVKDEIETPNDISGVVYIKMDNEDAWQLKLAKELKNSGYEIEIDKLL
jgi:predicted nucleotide-binding protein